MMPPLLARFPGNRLIHALLPSFRQVRAPHRRARPPWPLAAWLALAVVAAALLLLRLLPRLPFGRKLILEADMDAADGFASAPPEDRMLLGRSGRTLSALRPAGVAEIDGHRVDVVSEGNYVPAGTPIDVTRVDGNRIVVRPRHALPEGDPST